MASIKIKFRPSIVSGKQGTLYYQVIHNRAVRQLKTNYKLFPDEWDNRLSEIIVSPTDRFRNDYLTTLKKRISQDMDLFVRIVSSLTRNGGFTGADVITAFQNQFPEISLFDFMQDIINRLRLMEKSRTCETYMTTLNSFVRFRNGKDVRLKEVDSDLMIAYEDYLKNENLTMNTISFYMRILRAVYNRAVEKELTGQKHPFKHVYTGIDKTVKRAVSLKIIKQIKQLDLIHSPSSEFARDLFLFSFYTRGMSFIDIAYLRKKDLNNKILTYRRRKTGQLLSIGWEPCMQQIVDKYQTDSTLYLFPILRDNSGNERNQYKNALFLVNRKLKRIAEMIGLTIPLTMYVARHSWASIAKSKNIPVTVISEGMGHGSETTTQIYLASLDTAVVDNANRLILKLL